MSSKKTPREEYLRNRYLRTGPAGFTPKDALELILGYCFNGPELYRAMDALFERFGSVDNIINADCDELREVPGMTESSATLLAVMPELYRITGFARTASSYIFDPESACKYFTEAFRGANVEQLKVACLDENFFVIRCITVGGRSTFGVDVDTDGLLRDVIRSKCRICVIAHNHPGGSSMPSEKDILSTRQLTSFFRGAGIDLLDHIIIGRDGARSMLDRSK